MSTLYSATNWFNFKKWLKSPLGLLICKQETPVVKKKIGECFGQELLLLGDTSFAAALEGSPVLHKTHVYPFKTTIDSMPTITASFDALPFVSDSINAIYLSHCLEQVVNPQEVLHEAFRVLVPEGSIIITGFNPWSLWGLFTALKQLFFIRTPWQSTLLSFSRLQNWLRDLSFDEIEISTHLFSLPLNNKAMLEQTAWLEYWGKIIYPLGGAWYVITARKRCFTLTPIEPALFTIDEIVEEGLAEPSI